jgi:hypothetical protein
MIKLIVSAVVAGAASLLLVASAAGASASDEDGPVVGPSPAPSAVADLLGGFPTCC